MNTTEVKIQHEVKDFNQMYNLAYKQFLAFEKIEGIENWKEYNFSIDCASDQMRFKEMLQVRFIEELTEATHALDNKEHFFEEMIDAVNFFLSAYIMLGIDLKQYPLPELGECLVTKLPTYTECAIEFYNIIDKVGYLCNLLKNRPWAQSNYLVSLYDFNKRIYDLWVSFWNMLKNFGISKSLLFELFERKYIVNKWRIRTGY